MKFSVVYPYPSMIDADSFKEAIKQYVKINHNMSIHQMILNDRLNHVNADLNYYRQNNVDKVGINMYPISPNYLIPPNFYGPVQVQSLIPNTNIVQVPTFVPSYMPRVVNIDIPNNL
jgi:hypothetical protein